MVTNELASLKSRFRHGDNLETCRSLSIKYPIQHGEIAWDEFFPNSFKHLDRDHSVELSFPAFGKTDVVSDQNERRLRTGNSLSVIHEPDSNTASESCCLDPFLC
jgi:hypothetical protein